MLLQRKRYVLCAVLLMVGVTLSGQAREDMSVVVRSLNGRVEFRETGGDWQRLVEGYELPLGATVSTGFNSNAVLEVGLAVLEVQALSRLTIEELLEREGVVESDLYLEVGQVRADVRRTEDRRADFRLRSPVATAAVRGTSFSFDGRNLQVSQGVVEIANLRGRSSVVPAGYRSQVASGDAPPPSPRQAAQERTTVSTDTTSRVTDDEDITAGDDERIISDDDLPDTGGGIGTAIIYFH